MNDMVTVKSLCERCIVLSKGKVIFEGDTDQAIAVYMKNEALDDTTFFDTSDVSRHPKCNQRHLLQSLEILGKDTPQLEYGEKFYFIIKWLSENDDETLKIKLVVNTIDASPVGVAFGGELKHQKGENSATFTFDTNHLVPGKYTVDVILYDNDDAGNVMFYDRTTALRFTIAHGEESVKLKHWFKNWGYAVLPCIEQIDE